MNPIILETSDLTKSYGRARGVINLDLEVREGEVFGFLGPNGAGKTTTIRTLLDFIRPTSGSTRIFGLDAAAESVAVRRRVGYLPGELELYKNMKGMEIIRYFASLRGGVEWDYVAALSARFEYDASKPIKALSTGNRHKLGIVLAFMNRPDLLILDEPTTGLDPLMQQEFYRLILEVKQEGRTILISSHNLPEVERVCDRVGIIRNGRLITVESVAELKTKALRRLEFHFARAISANEFADLDGIQELSVDGHVLSCTVKGPLDQIVKRAARFELVDLISKEPDLEEVFLAYYGSGNHDAA